MSQIQALKIRLRPDRERRFRDFVASLQGRQALDRTLSGEGMRIESLFFGRDASGPWLLLYQRCDDLAAAHAWFSASTEAFDAETKAVLADCWGEIEVLELLADHELDGETWHHRFASGE